MSDPFLRSEILDKIVAQLIKKVGGSCIYVFVEAIDSWILTWISGTRANDSKVMLFVIEAKRITSPFLIHILVVEMIDRIDKSENGYSLA